MRLNAAIAIKAQGSSWAANGAPRGNWFKGRLVVDQLLSDKTFC